MFAGALADVVDRRRLLLTTQAWMMLAAAGPAMATLTGVVTPPVLLGLMFVFCIGFAFTGPASKAVIDDLVPAAQLAAAIALNGVVVNVGRAAGPALAGVLIAAAGPGAVFAINAVSFVGALVVLARWRRPTPPPPGPRENVSEAVAAGVRFVRFTPTWWATPTTPPMSRSRSAHATTRPSSPSWVRLAAPRCGGAADARAQPARLERPAGPLPRCRRRMGSSASPPAPGSDRATHPLFDALSHELHGDRSRQQTHDLSHEVDTVGAQHPCQQ